MRPKGNRDGSLWVFAGNTRWVLKAFREDGSDGSFFRRDFGPLSCRRLLPSSWRSPSPVTIPQRAAVTVDESRPASVATPTSDVRMNEELASH